MLCRPWLVMLFTFLLVTAGCDGPPESALAVVAVPRGAVLPAMAITLTPAYEQPSVFLPRTERFEGHAYLRVDEDGAVAGTLSVDLAGRSFLTPVTGHVERDAIVLDSEVVTAGTERLQWDTLRLALLDGNGDHEIDGAAGEARGTWSASSGEHAGSSLYAAAIAATRDTSATEARIAERDRRLPFGVVTIDFAEPVRRDQAMTALRVLAGGAPVAGTFEGAPVDGLITGTRFLPSDFLPFDQVISLDVGELTDPSGNPITAAASSLRVVADPSPATVNLGFENGLSGWTVIGPAESTGSVGGIAPAEGSGQAVVDADGTLAGYLDVPGDAARLQLSIARLSQLQEVAGDYTAVVTLHRANGDTVAGFDAREAADAVVRCAACGPPYSFQLGPLSRDIDLAPVRGERVWITVEARTFSFIGMPALAVLVDDLRVVTSK